MKTRQLFLTILMLAYVGIFTTAFAANNSTSLDTKTEIKDEKAAEAVGVSNSVPTLQTDPEASLDEFPNLHPLVVHFPIALLFLAVVLQLIQLFTMNRTLDWVVLLTVGAGFIGAYVAGNFVHPHTEGLTETAKKVLEQHDKYAMWAMWSSAAAALLKLVSLFWFKQKRWFEILVFLVLAFSGYSVGWAGHYGSQLVYIEGVGPQGNYLGNEAEEGHGGHSH
ncbi:DUF2231 domain-containing protein [Galbibacter pacificus]|uniref:DUF2231 domain-containing protein n=1 Tax=Galbibacter pacificus TaxID=2996052 RepID=A0ABT6FTD8_9FLAO|nr:DUF2231 domain-containing protein [Galbibacter pacificus]MDG3582525.1 hypothetical protein [Galbibacter pacificus]MDG3586356.1 hypothetical protein [Galbibacter pacificus]